MIELYCGDVLAIMPTIPSTSIDAIITDPPYPEIDREYGRMTEADWWAMMMGVCAEARRVLKPTGSAVFILQPNSRKVGSMRGWLWEFMAWVCREWNMVQDVWWWNTNAMPWVGATTKGLMRGAIRACVWAGPHDCHREQGAVLWSETESNIEKRAEARAGRRYGPSGHSVNEIAISGAATRRGGGVTPFNILPIKNNGPTCAGNLTGHGAGTPLELAKWWTRYICPPGGTVLDPFVGSGTMMLAAMEYGCNGIGIDKMGKYIDIAQRRVDEKQPAMAMAGAV